MTIRKIRLWPLMALLALDGFFVLYTWLLTDAIRQTRLLNTILAQVIVFLAGLIWLLFFSRLRWKVRLTLFSSVVLLIAAFFTLFKVKEVTGDVLPIFEWRWAHTELSVTARFDADALQRALNDSVTPLLDYSQFLGETRTAVIRSARLETNWQKHPPQLLWKQPIGEGWSSFATRGNLAVTQEQHGGQEMVICYNIKNGELIWAHGDAARYSTPIGGTGPRATPTLADNRVYTLGATGILNALDLQAGRLYWSKNILTDNGATAKEWGMSGSPLVLDSLVVVCAGGPDNRSLVAYHKITGERVWSGGNDRAGYSSPMLTKLFATPQILIFTDKHVVSHTPQTGDILWQFAWPGETQKVAQPVLLGENSVFVTSGYGVGSKLYRITRDATGRFQPQLMWKSNRLKAKFTNVVVYDDAIYGLDDGILVSLDTKTGKRNWKRGRYGHGQVMLIDDVLLVVSEQGDVVLVSARPDRHEELARYHAIDGKTWNNPAFAAPYLLVRNSREAACYKLALREESSL